VIFSISNKYGPLYSYFCEIFLSTNGLKKLVFVDNFYFPKQRALFNEIKELMPLKTNPEEEVLIIAMLDIAKTALYEYIEKQNKHKLILQDSPFIKENDFSIILKEWILDRGDAITEIINQTKSQSLHYKLSSITGFSKIKRLSE
jgi:hypothetical protein